MEVDEKFINNLDIEKPELLDVFKPEYEGQNVEESLDFIKFKESMLKKYGKKAKKFYCKIDKIYFFYDYSKYPYEHFKGNCPLCNNGICYFCFESNYDENCCFKKKIYHLLNVDAMIFLDNTYNFTDYLLFILVPYLNCLFFCWGIHALIYELKTNIKYYHYRVQRYYTFIQYIVGDNKHWNIVGLIIFLDVFSVIILSIPFISLDIFFTLLLLIISIPFKFYPLKYLFGIAFSGMKQTILF